MSLRKQTIVHLMTKSVNGIQNGDQGKRAETGYRNKLNTLQQLSDNCSKPEDPLRIAATAALTKLKPNGRHNNISPGSKVKLMRLLSFLFFCMPLSHGP